MRGLLVDVTWKWKVMSVDSTVMNRTIQSFNLIQHMVLALGVTRNAGTKRNILFGLENLIRQRNGADALFRTGAVPALVDHLRY